MGDKNQLSFVQGTDVLSKTGHSILKAIYPSLSGDRVFSIYDGASACAATGTFTLACAVACDTVVVNGLTYTGVAGAKANNTQFSIDTSDCAAATDLALSITCDCRTGTTVTTVDQTATACGAVVTITASSLGTIGNSIDISSGQGTITASGTTLSGGTGVLILTTESGTGVHSMPYINHPAKDGLYINVDSGSTGAISIVYE